MHRTSASGVFSAPFLSERGFFITKASDMEWQALIRDDGAVTLSHEGRDDIYLNSREQLHTFIQLHDLGRSDIVIVDPSTQQAAQPIEQ